MKENSMRKTAFAAGRVAFTAGIFILGLGACGSRHESGEKYYLVTTNVKNLSHSAIWWSALTPSTQAADPSPSRPTSSGMRGADRAAMSPIWSTRLHTWRLWGSGSEAWNGWRPWQVRRDATPAAAVTRGQNRRLDYRTEAD